MRQEILIVIKPTIFNNMKWIINVFVGFGVIIFTLGCPVL